MKKVRALVVDDSGVMRAVIRATLEADRGIEVVGEAANPLEAREAIKALNPDVMTLDVEMPHMNGIEFLEKVMRLRPLPVVMVSSLTDRGAATTIAALEIGAIDCVGKPSPETAQRFRRSGREGEGGGLGPSSGGALAAAPGRAGEMRRRPARRSKAVAPAAGWSRSAPRRAASRRWRRSFRNFPGIARRRW